MQRGYVKLHLDLLGRRIAYIIEAIDAAALSGERWTYGAVVAF